MTCNKFERSLFMIFKISDVAKRWGVTRQSVKNEMEKGKLKYFTYGSEKNPRYRIREDWIEEFERGGLNGTESV
jgi:hypothetical protein